ncbi:HAD-IB family hydrolase [Actinokineospora bangkokensis]|uniref:Inhibition of morphological differentiation protein n=1 Tax=Actinokineospora bangkokensis TaxID=1193682 RepID=A0A1Q9LCG6_9PSEU|nr:HAD-IB family hydrolase [Actinokineospora bangkokensis]OLR89720.1 inhibition of morphological differentiation protein [Actinokineospora bangkokensis]
MSTPGAEAGRGAAACRAAAFFDLDKTVIAASSALAFSRPFFQGGLINRRGVLRSAYAQLVFAASGADAEQVARMRAHLTSLCTGWDVAQVRSIVEEALHDVVDPLVYAEAAALVAEHRADGRDVVIVSASGAEIVAPIARMIGATHSVGTEMVAVDGRYTGEIAFYCYGPQKAAAVRELAERNGYDLAASHAYSDSSTDLPMLEAVGHPSVVNPDRGLRKVAVERQWPVLTFSKPVPLRGRSGTAIGIGIGAVATVATAGAAWYGLQRRRRR